MIEFFRKQIFAFFVDAGTFERYMRALWGFIAGSVGAIVISIVTFVGPDVNKAAIEVRAWSKADWIARLLVGALFAFANGRKTKTMSIDEIHAALAERGAVPPQEKKP